MGFQHTLDLAAGDTIVIVTHAATLRVDCHKMDENWSLLLQYRAGNQTPRGGGNVDHGQPLRGRPGAASTTNGPGHIGPTPIRAGSTLVSGQTREYGDVRQTDGLSLVPAKGIFGQLVPAHLLTPRETAKVLRISERTLWTITKSGSIQAVRFGRAVRYNPDAIKQWIQEHSKRGGM